MSHQSASVQLPAAKWRWNLLTPKIRFSLIIYHDCILFTVIILVLVSWSSEDGQQWINYTIFTFYCLHKNQPDWHHPATLSHLHLLFRCVSPVCSNMCLSHGSVFNSLFMHVCQLPTTKFNISHLLRMDLFFILSLFFFFFF